MHVVPQYLLFSSVLLMLFSFRFWMNTSPVGFLWYSPMFSFCFLQWFERRPSLRALLTLSLDRYMWQKFGSCSRSILWAIAPFFFITVFVHDIYIYIYIYILYMCNDCHTSLIEILSPNANACIYHTYCTILIYWSPFCVRVSDEELPSYTIDVLSS